MAENRNLHVQLTVGADVKQAQNEFANLLSSLQKIQTIPKINIDDADLKKASQSAQELQSHLQAAFNVNTGKLDLSQFSASLSKSDKQLEDYYKDLLAIGEQGQKAFLQVAQSIASADAPLRNANSKLNEFLGTLKNTARWQISSSILHGFMGSISSAYNYAQDLNKSLNNIQIVTQKNSSEMAEFAKQANKAATELNTTTLKYSDASLIYFQQGLNTEEVQKRADVTIKMAHASGQAVQEVSQQLTSVWNNFAEGSDNLEYYADVMTALGAATASSSTEIASGLQKFASIGKTVGLSYEYAASALATITATTRESAETVGNALKTLFARLQGLKLGKTLEDGVDLNKYSAALEAVGVHVLDANGALREADEILDDLMAKWVELDNTQQTALAQTVAGQRQYAQFMTLMNQSEFFKQNVEVANNSEGTVEKQAEVWEKSWQAAKERVQQALNDVYEKLVDDQFFINLSDVITVIINRVSDLIDGFGGIYGILGTLGNIFAQKFAAQVPQFLDNLNQKMLIATGTAREMAAELQLKNADQVQNLVASDTKGTENSLDLQTQKIQQISEMKAELIRKEQSLSDAERRTYELQIKKVEATYDNVDAYAKELDKINEEIEGLQKIAIKQSTSQGNSRFDTTVSINEWRDYYQQLESIYNVQEQIGNQSDIWQKQGTNVEEIKQKTQEWVTSLEQAGNVEFNSTSSALIKLQYQLQDENTTAKDILQTLNEIATEGSDAFLVNGQSAEQLTQIIADCRSHLENDLGIAPEILDKMEIGFQKSEAGAQKYTNALRLISQEGKKAFDHQTHFSEALMKTVGTLSQFSALLNSVQRFSDVLTDKDATVVSKLTAAIGLLTTAMMFASSAAGTLKSWKDFNTASSIAQALAEGTLTGATGALTIAMNALKASFLTNPLFLAGAAIIGTIIGISTAIQKENKAREEHIENLKKEADLLEDEYQKQKTELEDKDKLIEEYETLRKKYEETGQGKAALIAAGQALADAYNIENGNILLLKGNYEGLTKAVYEYRDADIAAMKTTLDREKHKRAEAIEESVRPTGGQTAVQGKAIYGFYTVQNDVTGTAIDPTIEDFKNAFSVTPEVVQELSNLNNEALNRILENYDEENNAFLFETEEARDKFADDLWEVLYGDNPVWDAKARNYLDSWYTNVGHLTRGFISKTEETQEEILANSFRFKDSTKGYQKDEEYDYDAKAREAVDKVVSAYEKAGKEATLRISDVEGQRGDLFIDALGQQGEDYYAVYDQAKQWKEEFEKLFPDGNYDYENSKVWQQVNKWLDENKETFEAYEEVLNEYNSVELMSNTDQIEQNFLDGLDDKKIDTVKEYEDFINHLRTELKAYIDDEEAINTIIDARYGKYGKYADLALQLEAAEDKRKNASSEEEIGRIDSLEDWLIKNGREEDLQFFGYIDFDEEKSNEEYAEEIDKLKEKADHEELKIKVKSQVAAAEGLDFKSGMNRSELRDFKESSGIEWDTEINGVIIEWEKFLAASDAERKEMLEGWARDTLESDRKILEEDKKLAEEYLDEKKAKREELEAYYYDENGNFIQHFEYDENKSEAENQRAEQFAMRAEQRARAEEKAAEEINEAKKEESEAQEEYDVIDAELTENELLRIAEIKTAIVDLKDTKFESGQILDKELVNNLKDIHGLNLDLSAFTIDGGNGQLIVKDPEGLNKAVKEAMIKGAADGSLDIPMQDLINNFDDLYMIPEGWIKDNEELYKIITKNVVEQGEWAKEVKDFDSLMTHVTSGEMSFAEGWKQAGSNIKEISLDEFNKGLKEFEESEAEEKAQYISEAIGKINDIASASPEDLAALKETLEAEGATEEWEKVAKQVDLTGKSFAEIREYKDILDPETLAKYNKEALATTTNLDEIKDALEQGDIEADDFNKKIQELLNNGDITLEEALNAIYEELRQHKITGDEASEAIDKLLSQSGVSTEERLEAIRQKISEGIAEAEDFQTLLKEILGDTDKSLDEKNAELDKTHHEVVEFKPGSYRGEDVYDLNAEDRAAGKLELANDEFASIEQRQQFLEEAIALLQQADAQGEISVGNWKTYGDQIASAIQAMGEAGGEYFPKIAEGFGLAFGEDNSSLPADQLIAFGQSFSETLDGLDIDAEQKLTFAQRYLESLGLSLEEVGIKAEDFGEKTKESFTLDTENLTVGENFQKLNEALEAGTIDIDEYGEHLKTLMTGELDWTVTHEDAVAALFSFQVGLERSKGTLNEHAKALGEECTSIEDLNDLMAVMNGYQVDNETKTKAETAALLKLGNQYKSCTQEVKNYEAALRSGNKTKQETAKQELTLAARSAEQANNFGLEEEAVKTLAQSYMELGTIMGSDGKEYEMTAEMATDLATRYLNLNNGIADLQSNWEDYSDVLTNLQSAMATGDMEAYNSIVADQRSELEGLRGAMAEVLNLTDSTAISDQFLAENAQLVEEAMNGDAEAVAALQVKMAEGLEAEITVNDEPFHAKLGEDDVYLSNWLENLPEGVLSLDDTEYLQTLVNAMAEAGYANEEIEEKLKGLGIEIEWDNAPLQQAVADSQEAAELLTQAGEEAGEGWAEGASTDSEVVEETNTNEDEHKYVSTDVSTNPLSYQVTVPEYHMSSTDNGFAITGGPKQINLTYDEIKVEPQEEPAKQTTTDTTVAHKIKTAHKTHGGNISHKNLSGGNKRTNGGGSSRPSRPARESAPRTSQVRVPDVSSYIERKTYDQKTHDQKYIAPERLEDYKKDPVLKDLPNLKEYMDEVYTTRKKFYNERYDKDKKVSEKEYETKDSSMFKRASEEIEQYHDINNILDKIGYKLDEINQRKSRAFGKAHIDAINEEKKALEEQLAAQNQYLNEMGSRRKELQEQMKAQGWEFDENGSISNYVSKKTADVAQYNAGMEQFVEQANINRAEWNRQAHEITDTYNQMNRDAIDVYNSAMNELTDSTNSQYAAIDQAKNAAQKTMVDAYNNTLTSAAANKFNAEVQANAEYEAAMKAAVEAKNSADKEAIAARDELLTSAEEGRNRALDDAISVRETALSDAYRTYQNATAGLEGEYEEGLADYYQSIVDDAKAAYDDSVKAAEDAYKNATSTAENAYTNTTKKIENDYDLLTKKADVAFKNAKTDAEADLKRKNAEAAQEYKAAQQEATHQYNVAKQQADRIYTEGKRLIDEGYDDQSHEIKNNLQDMKDLATDFYDDSIEQIDKTFESAEHLNEIAKEYTEFAYDESEKMRSEYESLEDTMAQAMLDAQELRNKIYDNALEVIDYTLNLKVQLSNEVMTALTALLDSLGDAADKATDRIATLGQQMYQFTYQTKANRDAIYDLLNSQKEVDSNTMNRFMNGSFTQDDLNKLFNLDEFTADKIANLETYRDNLVSLISEQRALKESMFEVVSGAFSEYQTSLNLQIEKITSLTKVTQTYKNIVNIVGKKVLDASGELSETLSKAAFETQRDQTHTYKSILDEIDSNIADMKQKQAAFDIDSEMFKDFQKRIDDMEAERKSAQDNWLSSWEAEMQAAADYYANAIDTITRHFDESISGLIGSLDLLNKEYERQKKIEDIYVEDYEKIYQLSKLTRDIEEAIDNSDHVKNKQKLKKLQDEINQASKDGVKLSQYDLDVLRKKFELELARDELEESRNAKSQVRMMRDAEGNYGYVYTADANAVADAEQNYEDKLHELQVLNTDYIKQLEDNYLELQQNVRDEIASLDITQFATEEEYLAEVERIQSAALELQERMSQQMGNALGNNRDLYENEWTAYSQMTGYKISADEDYLDKFNETTYSVLTGFQTMSEAKDQFTQSLAEAILGAIEAYRTTAAMQEIAMQDGGTSMADFAQDAIQSTEQIIDETEALATEAENLSETYQDAFGQIADSAADFAENYVKNIQPVIDSNLQLLDTIAKIIEHQANLNGQSGDGSGSGGVVSGVKSNGTTWSAFGSVGDAIGAKTKIAEYLPWIAAVAKFADYTTNSGGWGTGDTRRSRLNEVFGPGAAEDFEKYWNEYAATGALGEYWDPNNWQKFSYETMKKMKFDTGGYTGQWNSVDGKLALLHEKELVLNQSDTNNILEAVDMIRKITQMIDLNALSAESFLGNMLTAANISTANNDVLQQEVHITAEFPNATDRDEIIAAFDNLTNLAMQYAGKQNYV